MNKVGRPRALLYLDVVSDVLSGLEAHSPREDVCAKYTAHYVAKMGDIVDIGKGGGDQDISLSCLWQDLMFGGHWVRRVDNEKEMETLIGAILVNLEVGKVLCGLRITPRDSEAYPPRGN